jgi:hypothetical protein
MGDSEPTFHEFASEWFDNNRANWAERTVADYEWEQIGHEDVRFTLNVYTKAVKRRDKLTGAYLAEFDRALAWATLAAPEKAPMGTGADSEAESLA